MNGATTVAATTPNSPPSMANRRSGEMASVQRMVREGARPEFVVRTKADDTRVEIVVNSLPWLHPMTVVAASVLGVARAAIASDLGIPSDSFDLAVA